MPNNKLTREMSLLRKLEINAGSEEGARPIFQKLILHLVKLKHKNARGIRAAPGDWGIDVFVGRFTSGTCLIWQAKYFVRGIGDSQKKQIRESFSQLVKKSKEKKFCINVWYLCVPCTLSGPETKWWENWSTNKTKETGIEIRLMSKSDIEKTLMAPDAEYIRNWLESGKTGTTIPQTHSFGERMIEELPDEKSEEYENSLFIQKLVIAGITENMSAKCQFFNAELAQKEIHDKGNKDEIAELKSLYEKIHSMWETRFNEALQSASPKTETRKVYIAMLKSIEQMDKSILDSPKIPTSFFHKQGFMQQLADICKIGWTPDFHKLDNRS